MGVLLPDSDEQDGLSGRLHHVNSCAHFLVNGVKLCQHDAVNRPWVSLINSKINQSLIKFRQLVNSVVANESLADEEYDVGLIYKDEFSQLPHQLFVALHTACGVDQNHVVVLTACFLQSFLCDDRWIILIPLLVDGNVEASRMGC